MDKSSIINRIIFEMASFKRRDGGNNSFRMLRFEDPWIAGVGVTKSLSANAHHHRGFALSFSLSRFPLVFIDLLAPFAYLRQ